MQAEHFASKIPVYCAFDEIVSCESLKPNPRNPREHPVEQLDRYEAVIRGNGWRRAVVVSSLSGFIVKGHGAYETAKRRGWDVPIEIQKYSSAAEETRDLLADNQLSALAATDDDKLRELLNEIGETEIDLSGFSKVEMDQILQEIPIGVGKTDARAEWAGMPECENDDLLPWRRLIINFASREHLASFAELIGQSITDKTRSVWFPPQEILSVKDISYIDES